MKRNPHFTRNALTTQLIDVALAYDHPDAGPGDVVLDFHGRLFSSPVTNEKAVEPFTAPEEIGGQRDYYAVAGRLLAMWRDLQTDAQDK